MTVKINLWSVLNQQRSLTEKGISQVQDVTREDLVKLGNAERFSMQELVLKSYSQGWILEIFGVNEDSGIVEIFIPKDRSQPARILRDE